MIGHLLQSHEWNMDMRFLRIRDMMNEGMPFFVNRQYENPNPNVPVVWGETSLLVKLPSDDRYDDTLHEFGVTTDGWKSIGTTQYQPGYHLAPKSAYEAIREVEYSANIAYLNQLLATIKETHELMVIANVDSEGTNACMNDRSCLPRALENIPPENHEQFLAAFELESENKTK